MISSYTVSLNFLSFSFSTFGWWWRIFWPCHCEILLPWPRIRSMLIGRAKLPSTISLIISQSAFLCLFIGWLILGGFMCLSGCPRNWKCFLDLLKYSMSQYIFFFISLATSEDTNCALPSWILCCLLLCS